MVVRKGFLFTEDKVVPIGMIGPTTEDSLTLRPDAGDLDELPDYRETDYIEVDLERQPMSNSAFRAGELPAGKGILFRNDMDDALIEVLLPETWRQPRGGNGFLTDSDPQWPEDLTDHQRYET